VCWVRISTYSVRPISLIVDNTLRGARLSLISAYEFPQAWKRIRAAGARWTQSRYITQRGKVILRKILTFVLPIALVACASGPQESAPAATGAASTAKAERPEIKVSDRWVTVCAYGITKSKVITVVTSVDQSGIKGTWNGEPWSQTPDLNNIESPIHKDSDARRLSFPLEVGKEWRAANQWVNLEYGDHGSEELTVKVVGYEKVRVPAGELDAFKLKWKSSFNSASGGGGIQGITYWYAPAARAVVKSDQLLTWQGGGQPEVTCELAEFQLQP